VQINFNGRIQTIRTLSSDVFDESRFLKATLHLEPPAHFINHITVSLALMLTHSSVFLSEWSIYGIVCLTGLFLLTPWTHLKRDWINSGTVKIPFMTSQHNCREPEVGVKCCLSNSSKSIYCKVVTWCGHRCFEACARKLCLPTSTS